MHLSVPIRLSRIAIYIRFKFNGSTCLLNANQYLFAVIVNCAVIYILFDSSNPIRKSKVEQNEMKIGIVKMNNRVEIIFWFNILYTEMALDLAAAIIFYWICRHSFSICINNE